MEHQNEYKKIYLQESDELLQQLNTNLLILEKEPKNIEAINAIFRSVHTLKSMSASMGYSLIADLSHKMEDILDEIRTSKINASEDIIDLLFKSFDCLESMANEIQNDQEISVNIEPILSDLDKFIIKGPQICEEKICGNLNVNIFEKHTLFKAKKEGYFCYQINITLEESCVLKSARAFMVFRNLHSIGEVIKSIPDSRLLEEEKFDREFSCVFVTKEKEDLIRNKILEILDVEKAQVKEIEINESEEKELLTNPSLELEIAREKPIILGESVHKIQSVRVDIKQLDKLMNLVEEMAINKLRLADIGMKTTMGDLKAVIEVLDRLTNELQEEVMQARLVPVSQIFDRFPRLVRDLAKKENKLVKFDVIGGDIELDRTVLDEIGDPLIHTLKNAIDHGIESPEERKEKGKREEARIMLSARREKTHIFIEIEDDGKGMDVEKIKKSAVKKNLISEERINSMTTEEILLLTTHPGFTTKDEVSEVSGRGVGLDVARQTAETLGGSLIIESTKNKGTKITMRLPITTAVIQALMVEILDRTFAVPISNVEEIVFVKEGGIKTIEGRETILHRDSVLPIVRLDKLFWPAINSPSLNLNKDRLNIVIVEYNKKQYGIVVEKLLMQQDIVIKQLTKDLKGIRGFAGATILGNGSVALILDVATLV